MKIIDCGLILSLFIILVSKLLCIYNIYNSKNNNNIYNNSNNNIYNS